MKKILFLLLFYLAVQAADNKPTGLEETPLLSNKEWLLSFNQKFSMHFCEQITKEKVCRKLSSSDCLGLIETAVQKCEKSFRIPAAVAPGMESTELATKLAVCSARDFERVKKTHKGCQE